MCKRENAVMISKPWLVILLVLLVGCMPLSMTGCRPKTEIVPAKYTPRQTENGVWIFEYDPGNQANSSAADRLDLFIASLNQFNKDHPDLAITSMENISTNITFRGDNQNRSVSLVHVIVYTQPKGCQPKEAQPKEAQPKGK